jgi:hypothetical protein
MTREWLFVDALYERLFQEGIQYFIPHCTLEMVGEIAERKPSFEFRIIDEANVEACWLGSRYCVSNHGIPFTTDQWRMVNSIGTVLSGRLRLLLTQGLTPRTFNLFRGLNEDRYVSAFLDPFTYGEDMAESHDRVGDVIDVLRVSAHTKYEGVRSGSGALLLGRTSKYDVAQALRGDAVRYSVALTSIRSFHRLSDGVRTVAIIDATGLLVDLADIREWAEPFAEVELPVPGATRYECHAKCTVSGGHVCLVLTTNQEIKIFANGRPVLQFLSGRWRLIDAYEKFREWESAVGNKSLARCIFRAALNLAEDRCGGLLVVLDDPRIAPQLVAKGGLAGDQPRLPIDVDASKEHLHYLARGKLANELAPAVLESIASVDGAVLFDPSGTILSFGAILHDPSPGSRSFPMEGGRATAALAVSQFGKALKISEDGPISFYRNRSLIWEI